MKINGKGFCTKTKDSCNVWSLILHQVWGIKGLRPRPMICSTNMAWKCAPETSWCVPLFQRSLAEFGAISFLCSFVYLSIGQYMVNIQIISKRSRNLGTNHPQPWWCEKFIFQNSPFWSKVFLCRRCANTAKTAVSWSTSCFFEILKNLLQATRVVLFKSHLGVVGSWGKLFFPNLHWHQLIINSVSESIFSTFRAIFHS